MKSYLFYIFLLLPFGSVFSQIEKSEEINTNSKPIQNNSNNISIPIEPKKEIQLKKAAEKEAKELLPEMEEISAPVPAAAKALEVDDESLDLEKDVQTSTAVQIMNYQNALQTFSQQRTQRSLSSTQEEVMEDMLRNLSSSSPASFESYLFYYLNGQRDLTRSKSLLKANELKPNNPQVQEEMLTYFVLMNKTDETRKALLNLSQSEVYEKSVESYGMDMVNSAPSKATLITHGKEDSYGALFAQKVKRVREDVDIISLEWLTSTQYRTSLKSKGWILPESDFIDTKYLEEFCELNSDKKITVSMTLPKEYLIPILDKLYVSGLVFQYLDVPTDLTIRNEELWKYTLNKKIIDSDDKGLVNNYLPMLFQLKKVYQADGNSEAVQEIESTIQTITNR